MKKMTKREIVGGFVWLGIIVGVTALYVTGEHSDPPPFTWHYVGPASKAELVKQAVDVLTDACPRLYVYNEYIEKPNVAWRIVDRSDPLWRAGVRAAVNVSTRFKAKPVEPTPHMPIYPLDMFDG